MKSSTTTPATRRLATLAAALLLVLGAAAGARAQTWNETGDAGDLVSTAQTTLGTGAITAINGSLASSTDVDLYCVKLLTVPPAGLPLLELTCTVNQGPNIYLFDATGKGVFTDWLCSGGNKGIVAPAGGLPVGTYYVGVSYMGYDPQSSGGAIWLQFLSGQRAPDGPGAALPLTSWAGTPIVQPLNPYHVALSGFSFCGGPVPTLRSTWGLVKQLYR